MKLQTCRDTQACVSGTPTLYLCTSGADVYLCKMIACVRQTGRIQHAFFRLTVEKVRHRFLYKDINLKLPVFLLIPSFD